MKNFESANVQLDEKKHFNESSGESCQYDSLLDSLSPSPDTKLKNGNEYSGMDSLLKRISESGYEIKDNRFLKNGNEIGYRYEHKLFLVRVKLSDLPRLDDFFDILNANGVPFDTGDPYDLCGTKYVEFTVYPLTEDEKVLIANQIESDDGEFFVCQGECAFLDLREHPGSSIGTFGLGPCRGILVFSKKSKIAAMAHLDWHFGDSTCACRIVEEFERLNIPSSELEFHTTPNFDGRWFDLLNRKFNFKNSSQTAFIKDSAGVSSLTFSPEEGNFREAVIVNVSENFLLRLDAVTEIRMKYEIPFLMKKLVRTGR